MDRLYDKKRIEQRPRPGRPPPRRRHRVVCRCRLGSRVASAGEALRRWREHLLNRHSTGASNGPVEAANLLIKQVKRSGRGFRYLAKYRLRILLAGGTNPMRETQQVTSIRPRRPRLVP